MGDDLAAVVEANGRDDGRTSRPTTSQAVRISAPNLSAWRRARSVSCGPADTVGEAEVVLDPRALPGLPAGRPPLDEHRAQALRRGVHGGAEPGRTTADDDDVVEVGGGRRRQPDPSRQVADARRDEVLAAGRHDERDRRGVDPGRRQQPLPLGLLAREPPVGHGVAGEEVADLERVRRPAVADDLRFG